MQARLWTLNALSVELKRDRRSLARLLDGLKPDGSSVGSGDRVTRQYLLVNVLDHIYSGTSDGLDANKERARKDKEHADKLALENARTRAESISITQVVREVGDMIGACRSRLVAVPDAIGQILDVNTARTVVPAVRVKVYEALAELSQYRPALSDEADEAMEPAAHVNGESVG
jgi:hypothetical protein